MWIESPESRAVRSHVKRMTALIAATVNRLNIGGGCRRVNQCTNLAIDYYPRFERFAFMADVATNDGKHHVFGVTNDGKVELVQANASSCESHKWRNHE